MKYLSAEKISKSYGVKPLFENISFHIQEGDRIALIAKNGTGKSTLLKILSGKETADEGLLDIHKDVNIVFVEQDHILNSSESVSNNIFSHPHPIMNAIKKYETAILDKNENEIKIAVQAMDDLDAWNFEANVKEILHRLAITQLHQPVNTLSGGQKKRIALAKALLDIGFEHRHTLLLLDEPTNHLGIEMVEWLEYFLLKSTHTIFLITHDRYFLDNVCNEIWELDDGTLYFYKGNYQNYIEKKAALIESREATLDKAKNKFRKELDWMRRQPKARTTKSKSRQDAFYELEKQVKQKFENLQLKLQLKMSRLGGKVAELKKVYKNLGDRIILKSFDYTFKKGERIGLIGKNGVGKTTFLNLLTGADLADSGKINIGETVIFGYYSQQGLVLKQNLRVIEYVKTLAENFPLVSGGSLSASQFLQLFLFDAEKQYSYFENLSGGEKKRLQLLTVLFRNPNFLILDEPTNDLDIPTLQVLEDFLEQYQGCLIIVSHDRFFLDKMVDHLFVLEGDGIIKDFPGNYSQYKEEDAEKKLLEKNNSTTDNKQTTTETTKPKKKNRQLSYNDKREFELLTEEIPQLQEEKNKLTENLNNTSLAYEALEKTSLRLQEVINLIEEKEMRWLELSYLQEEQ